MHIPRSAARPRRIATILYILALFVSSASLAAEELNSSRGFFIDLPEGFALSSGDGQQTFSFLSPDKLVQADIFSYDPSRYPTIEALTADISKKLSAQGSPAYFSYAGRQAALAELRFGAGTQAMRGHALFINGEPRPKSPSQGQAEVAFEAAYDLVLIAYTASAAYAKNKDVLLSVIDGFSADAASRSRPGPVGSQARSKLTKAPAALAAPGSSDTAVIKFGKATISIPWQAQEGRLAQETVEREYRVLAPYGGHPELMQDAMKRFYRMVWRDSQASLEYLALQLSHAWETGAWAGTERSPSLAGLAGLSAVPSTNPSPGAAAKKTSAPRFGASAQSREYAAALLAWTQAWRYERSPGGSDVVNPLSAAMEGRGDCDSRVLVLISLLRRDNIEGILLISLVHDHALGAFDVPGSGARFPFNERQWLVAETTAKVDIGLIDQKQSSIGDWFAIDFTY